MVSPTQSWIQRVKVYFCLFTPPCSGLYERPGYSDTAVLRGADEGSLVPFTCPQAP